MTRLKSALISVLFLSSVVAVMANPLKNSAVAAPCQQCHTQVAGGVHQGLACVDCHGADGNLGDPAGMATGAIGCVSCHEQSAHIFHQAMTTRRAEQQFCQRSWGQVDPNFFSVNCSGCHVTSCLDCHGGASNGFSGDVHAIETSSSEACYGCHNGYFVGWDFAGRAPREDSVRYQRGPTANGQ